MFNLTGKGKQRASEDPWDISPDITYRHLLSKVPSVHNPLRVIALIDNDAFYASAERVRLGLSDDIPLAVQQWQALIAVSYKAREYGISRMDTVREAKQKCPELVAVHTATYREGDTEPAYHENPDVRNHKVSLDYYRRESKRIVEIYKELLPPGGECEKASIDECFFDFTLPVRDELVKRYPYLAQVPPDAPHGLDTLLPMPADVDVKVSWDGLGNLIPVLRSAAIAIGKSVVKESVGSGEHQDMAPEDDDDDSDNAPEKPADDGSAEAEHLLTWGDVALSIGAEIALRMRMQVKERLGYTTSGGIARNKVLAKLVASYKKRDTQSILRNAAIPGYWRPMPFQKIRFLGGKLGEHLSNSFDVKTVGELEFLTLEEMQRRFGEESIWVWNLLRGVDHSEMSERVANKSMLSSKNIRPPVMKVEEGEQWLRMLAGDLALRLTEAREITPTMWPKTLAIGIRQDNEPRQSRQCPFPYARNFSVETIITLAQKLWREITAGKQLHAKIHNISLSFHGLNAAISGQKQIEGFFSSAQKRTQDAANGDDDGAQSFICDKCSKRIALTEEQVFRAKEDDDMALERAMETLRTEHADYHFARSLAQNGSEGEDEVRVARPPAAKKKKTGGNAKGKPEPKGIAKFFTPVGAGPSKKAK